jgi:hypothetical protein
MIRTVAYRTQSGLPVGLALPAGSTVTCKIVARGIGPTSKHDVPQWNTSRFFDDSFILDCMQSQNS